MASSFGLPPEPPRADPSSPALKWGFRPMSEERWLATFTPGTAASAGSLLSPGSNFRLSAAHSRPLPAPGPSFSSGPPTASHLLQILPILRGGCPPALLSEHLPLGGGHSPDPLHMCSPWRHTTDARGVSGPLRHQDRPHVPQRPVSWSVGVWHTLRMKQLCFLLIT